MFGSNLSTSAFQVQRCDYQAQPGEPCWRGQEPASPPHSQASTSPGCPRSSWPCRSCHIWPRCCWQWRTSPLALCWFGEHSREPAEFRLAWTGRCSRRRLCWPVQMKNTERSFLQYLLILYLLQEQQMQSKNWLAAPGPVGMSGLLASAWCSSPASCSEIFHSEKTKSWKCHCRTQVGSQMNLYCTMVAILHYISFSGAMFPGQKAKLQDKYIVSLKTHMILEWNILDSTRLWYMYEHKSWSKLSQEVSTASQSFDHEVCDKEQMNKNIAQTKYSSDNCSCYGHQSVAWSQLSPLLITNFDLSSFQLILIVVKIKENNQRGAGRIKTY